MKEWKGVLAVFAMALMLAVAFVPVIAEDSDAANGTATINIQPGQTWSWTPSFTSGLSPTVTVSASDSAMPADNASFSTTSGNASVSDGTVTVSIPSNYNKASYYVKVRAQTTQPTQTVFYEITFSVATYTLAYNVSSAVLKVGTAMTEMTPVVVGATASSYAISGTLPEGLSFNTTTGVISGTPTAYKAQTNYTITATLATTPVQTVTKTVSIGAFENLSASNYTVYAITNLTDINVPAITVPTGTVVDSMSVTAKRNGSGVSVYVDTAYNGMTIENKTGKVTGKPTSAGTYTFTENFTATAATGGSTTSRTVSIVVEDQVSISGDSSFRSFGGHQDSLLLQKGSGPSSCSWTISEVKKDGTKIISGVDFSSITVSSNGVLTSLSATTPGEYTIKVKLATNNDTVTTTGATGTTPSANYAEKEVTLIVSPAISITNEPKPIYFYETEAPVVYDSLTLTSNVTGATFSATQYGSGISASNISIATTGEVTPGETSLTAGDYTVTVQAQDPNNVANVATETLNVHVVKVLTYTNAPSIGIIGS